MTDFTPAETIIFNGLAAGEATKTMAHRLGRSQRTIETQRLAVFKKRGVRTHIELLAQLLREAKEIRA